MESHDNSKSPTGWYVGSYLMRFVELESKEIQNPEKRFLSWENTILVQASSIKEAFQKVAKFAQEEAKPYKGGKAGVPVQWVYEGITELLPIYEPLADGAEIMWAEHRPKKLKNLRALVKQVHEFE